MRTIIFVLLFFCSASTFAQIKTVRGKISIDERGHEVYVYSRNIKTKTDKNGYYVLKNVHNEDWVVIPSMSVRIQVKDIAEVLETKPEPIVTMDIFHYKDSLGTFYFTDSVKTNNYNGTFNRYTNSISRQKDAERQNYYILYPNYYNNYSCSVAPLVKNLSVHYQTSLGLSNIRPYADLQTSFAQGREGVWKGADQNEIFSWGPALNTLEFSSANYAYDKNGALTLLGSGNGMSARSYDASKIFKTTYSSSNSIDITYVLKNVSNNESKIELGFGQKYLSGVLPKSGQIRNNANFKLKRDFEAFKAMYAFYYQENTSRLMQSGANINTLMHSIFTTPITFDNTNGFSSSKVISYPSSYLLSDGTQRSYAPNSFANPYFLLNNLRDFSSSKEFLQTVELSYKIHNRLKLKLISSYQLDEDKKQSGILNTGLFDQIINRDESQRFVSNSFSLDYSTKKWNNYNSIDYSINYSHMFASNNVSRFDSVSFLSPTLKVYDLNRSAHHIISKLNYNYRYYLYLTMVNRHYASSSLPSSYQLAQAPQFIFIIKPIRLFKLDDILNLLYYSNFKDLRFYLSLSKEYQESNLIYRDRSVFSTVLHSSNFSNFYETNELTWTSSLNPEVIQKLDYGLDFSLYSNRLGVEINFFNFLTSNFVAPNVITNGVDQKMELANVGKVKNSGFTTQLTADVINKRIWKWNVGLSFNRIRNKVLEVYPSLEQDAYSRSDEFIRMSGFSNIATVFAEGQSLGAIYGTSYLRNENGKIIVDAEGFPMVDTNMKKIGDANPDFSLGLVNHVRYKNLIFSMNIDYSHGGEVWNGTRAYLDYIGMSKETARLRSTTNYVFDGVDTNGNVNTIAVDFNNPANDISKNRWVRYGAAGVGEQYIENASFFRLSNVSVSYILNPNWLRKIRIQELKIGAEFNNVLLISSYQGTDPYTSLYGKTSGNGLDLFNSPSVRTANLLLTIKL